MAAPNRTPTRTCLTSLINRDEFEAAAVVRGVVQRDRKVDVYALVLTLALGYSVGSRRTLESLRRLYQDATGTTLARSSFDGRLNPRLAALLKQLALTAVERAKARFRAPEGALADFHSLLAIDSTVLRLHDLLAPSFEGCRTNHTASAAKLHVVMNVLEGGIEKVKLTSERVSDIVPWRRVGKWVKDRLLLFDLGYYSYHLFDRIDANGGFFVCRAKSNANPVIVGVNRKWRGRSVPVVGRKLQDVLPLLQRQVLDVVVEVEFKRRKYAGKRSTARRTFRLVAVRNDNTGDYHCYYTNVPADRIEAAEIASVYALRWQVELLFKALRQHARLGQLPSRRRCVVECLVWASVLAAVASNTLYQQMRRQVAANRHMPLLRWAGVLAEVAQQLIVLVLDGGVRADQRVQAKLLRDAPDLNIKRRRRALNAPPELCGG